MVDSDDDFVLQCCEKYKCWTAQLHDEGNCLPYCFFTFVFREVPSRHSKPKSSMLRACGGHTDQGVRKEVHLFGQKKAWDSSSTEWRKIRHAGWVNVGAGVPAWEDGIGWTVRRWEFTEVFSNVKRVTITMLDQITDFLCCLVFDII